MIVRLTADVESVVTGSETEEFEIGDYDANLQFEDGALAAVSIERELTDDEVGRLTNRVETPDSPTETGEITLGLPPDVKEDAERKLQAIESFGGIHGVQSLDWKYAEVELVPESDEEREEIDVLSYDFEEQREITPHHWEFDLDGFDWELIERLRVPLSLHRRGKQLLDDGDYINAYTNFYFIIEGFYSDAQHQNVERKFLNSDELMNVAQTSLQSVLDLMGDEVLEFFEFYGKDVTPEGYIRLLVVVRHQLNHFFGDEDGPHSPSPFQKDEYKAMARAIMHLTYLLLLMKVNEIEFAEP